MSKKVKEKREPKSDGKLRLPRFFGLTQLMNQYSKLDEVGKEELLLKAQDYVIQQWFLSNGNICGVSYSIYSLASFIKAEPDRVQLFMRDRVLSSKIWDSNPLKQNEILNGILGQQLAWVLEDRMEAQNQVEILKKSQNGKYMPFVSGELNKAIKLKLETGTSLQSVVRNLSGGGNVNIFAQINNQNNPGVTKGVTTEEALAIINENYGLLELEKGSKDYIEQHYDLDSLPVVVASDQSDMDLDREGLKIMRKDIRLVVDNYKGNLGEEADNDFHDIRRELELNIDEDEEDVEFEEYEK